MSGGSYDYLCYKGELAHLNDYISELERMIDRLNSQPLSYSSEEIAAEEEYRKLAASLLAEHLIKAKAMRTMFTIRHGKLTTLMKAVEWLDSGDWGPEDVIHELQKLTGEADADIP